jgi:hypothetical protein
MSDEKHRVTHIDHRGNETVLTKPPNESAMSQEQKDEWQRQRQKHLEGKKP